MFFKGTFNISIANEHIIVILKNNIEITVKALLKFRYKHQRPNINVLQLCNRLMPHSHITFCR